VARGHQAPHAGATAQIGHHIVTTKFQRTGQQRGRGIEPSAGEDGGCGRQPERARAREATRPAVTRGTLLYWCGSTGWVL
jgi:hypothetical protein